MVSTGIQRADEATMTTTNSTPTTLAATDLAAEWVHLVHRFLAEEVIPDAMTQQTIALTPACQALRPEDRPTYWATVINLVLSNHPAPPNG